MNALSSENQIIPERTVTTPVHVIRTGRLILKCPVDVEIKRLVHLANNRAIAENLATMPYPYTEKDALEWLERKTESRIGGKLFSIHLDIPGEPFIGTAGYGPMKEGGNPEIGYWIGEPYWGEGYGSEAARAIIDFAFEEDDVVVLEGGARITNVNSRRLLEKCGFEYQGFGKTYCRALDEEVPVDRFALTRPRFQGLKWRRQGRA